MLKAGKIKVTSIHKTKEEALEAADKRSKELKEGGQPMAKKKSDTKGLAGHPFINSELGQYLDHMKGDRKHRGHSKAKEVKLHRDHPYWRTVLGL